MEEFGSNSKFTILEYIAIYSYLFFYGLRGYCFTDMLQYHDLFSNIESQDFTQGLLGGFGPGYLYCNLLIYYFTENSFAFQFIWTLIDVLLLSIILKRECGTYFLYAFAFLIPFFSGIQINLFRNIKSILIFFWAIQYIRERKIIKYFVSIFIAATFHITALFYFPLYFFVNKPKFKTHLFISLFAILFCFVGVSLFYEQFNLVSILIGGKVESMTAGYITNDALEGGLTFGLLYRIFLLFAVLIFYKKLTTVNLSMLNTALLYLELSVAFNSILVLRDRMSVLFVLGVICIMPFLINEIKSYNYGKLIIRLNFLVLLGYVYVQHSMPIAEYENILFSVPDRTKNEQRISNLD